MPRFLVLALAACAGCGKAASSPPEAGAPVVFAAASLRDALTELGRSFAAAGHPPPVFHFAASNLLARQIEAADAADLFLPADEELMDRVERAGLLAPGSRRALLTNSLVAIQPAELPAGVPRLERAEDLLLERVERVALGNPLAVPAGRYAQAWLERAGLWEGVRTKVVPCTDVRAALALVASGSAQAGLVYATDAATSPRIRVAWHVPADEAPRIVYPLARIARGEHASQARALAEFLASPGAAQVFRRHGFQIAQGG